MLRRLLQPIVFVPVLIVVAIIGVWWFAFRADEPATASATTTKQVVEVTTGPMSQTVSAEGTVAAADTDDLSFGSSGTVTAVNVKAGDTVKSGQVLATIDSAELEAAVTSAEADLADAQAKLSDDQSGSASDAQITADESSVQSADDALANAQDALAGASLVATFDGTVASVDLTVGEELGTDGTDGTGKTGSNTGSGQSTPPLGSGNSNPLAANDSSDTSTAQIQVVSTGRFTVELAVDSADVAGVAVGQTATITPSTSSSSNGRFPGGLGGFFPNGGRSSGATNPSSGSSGPTSGDGATAGSGTTTATGTVTAVGKIADASSGVATYPVTIAFDAAADKIYVGSTVTGDIATNTRENVVQVSALAVTTTNGGSTVTVATDGSATGPTETRTVTTGLTANGNTEITSGLKAGEKVVIAITRPSGAGGFSPPSGGEGGFSPPSGGFQGGPPSFNGAGG